ncbi:MAG: hypothetical protein K8R88_02225 [Armatimonadetes bacterium]|nr:hypothetical protein [Armatimonadota bacterium]
MTGSQKLQGIGASLLLAAITLAVFATSANAGPESRVRSLIESAQQSNPKRFQELLTNPWDPAASESLFQFLIRTRGIPYQIVKSQIDGGQAYVVVNFLPPGGGQATNIFVLQRGKSGWKVNPYQTVHFMDSQP